ncbi:MAG: VWA domain-containing protein [Woeseiaceae bacterium]
MLLWLNSISWREPLWLLLCLQPLLMVFVSRLIIKRKTSLYADTNLQAWVVFPTKSSFTKITILKNIAYILAWAMFAVALAGPRTAVENTKQSQTINNNILLVLDLSRSMKTRDILPDRLTRAKIEIDQLLKRSHNNRIGLVVFAARPHLLVPLTYDYSVFKQYLAPLDNLQLPTMGSNVLSALSFAQDQLNSLKENTSIVLLTDGDVTDFTIAKINALKNSHSQVHVISIGTVEGDAVPLKDGTWLKFKNRDVISRTNEQQLKTIASELNGKYSTLYDDGRHWDDIYAAILTSQKPKQQHKDKNIVWKESFPAFLMISIILFVISLTSIKINIRSNRALFIFSLFIAFSITDNNAYAFDFYKSKEQQAYSAYQNKDYAASLERYKALSGYTSAMGQANSYFKLGNYLQATPLYISAVIAANNPQQRLNALYNLANCYFRNGNFKQAMQTYQDVLQYSPYHKESLYNIKISKVLYDAVQKRLTEKESIISSAQAGSGPRTSEVASGTEVNENSTLSTDGESTQDKIKSVLPELPNIDNNKLEALIRQGLRYVHFSDNPKKYTQNIQTNNTALNNDLTLIQQQTEALNDQSHLLWNRLFEIEEGFPAPVEKPLIVPGVNPW